LCADGEEEKNDADGEAADEGPYCAVLVAVCEADGDDREGAERCGWQDDAVG